MHKSHDWEQTLVQSLVLAKFSVGIFQNLSTLKDFNWIVSMVKKSDLKDNRSPGTVACAVIPRLGRLALWMIGLVSRL